MQPPRTPQGAKHPHNHRSRTSQQTRAQRERAIKDQILEHPIITPHLSIMLSPISQSEGTQNRSGLLTDSGEDEQREADLRRSLDVGFVYARFDATFLLMFLRHSG